MYHTYSIDSSQTVFKIQYNIYIYNYSKFKQFETSRLPLHKSFRFVHCFQTHFCIVQIDFKPMLLVVLVRPMPRDPHSGFQVYEAEVCLG